MEKQKEVGERGKKIAGNYYIFDEGEQKFDWSWSNLSYQRGKSSAFMCQVVKNHAKQHPFLITKEIQCFQNKNKKH